MFAYRNMNHITVRKLRTGDYPIFIAAYESCHPSLNRFDDGNISRDTLTPEWFEHELRLREQDAEDDRTYMYSAFANEGGRMIGYGNITTMVRQEFQVAHIGYTLMNTEWGKGYAQELIDAMESIGFEELGFHRLEAHINLDNFRSKRAIEKSGWVFENIRKKFILENGTWTDNEIWVKIKVDKSHSESH